MTAELAAIGEQVEACRICSAKFGKTATAHEPRPVFWCSSEARLLIAGQAPGAKVHGCGIFFNDASGDRLREWMGIDKAKFYDRSRIAILPMAFCFPGYGPGNSDLPPPAACAATWRRRILSELTNIETVLLVGRHSQAWHLGDGAGASVKDLVEAWEMHAPECYPLPHPSWRNNALIPKLRGFETGLLPSLRKRVAELT